MSRRDQERYSRHWRTVASFRLQSLCGARAVQSDATRPTNGKQGRATYVCMYMVYVYIYTYIWYIDVYICRENKGGPPERTMFMLLREREVRERELFKEFKEF